MAAKDKSVQINISAEVKAVLDAFDSAGKSIHKFGKQTEDIGKSIDGVFSPLMKGLTAAVAAIGAGMAALTKSALSVGGDFELTMTRVKGVTASTQEEFEQLTQKARDLGEALPISASEAAEAMYSLSSAGMTAKETLEAIEAVTGLSIAQNYDLAASANLMTATLRGFGLEADQSARVADVFNNVISSSMLNMEKLNDAMTYVAPVAKSLNISLEDTAAAMGKLADSGLKGEQIGTALRSMMLQLLNPTAEAAKELNRLGVTVTDVNGKLRPLDEIFQDLKNSGMTAAEAVKIFDKRSVAAALTMADVSGELKEYSSELGKLGRTQDLLAEQMQTFVNRAKAVKSALEETLLITFDQIQGQSKKFADEIRDMVLAFNEWAKETEIFGKVMNALLEGFGLATGNVGLFKDALDSIDVDLVVAQFRGFAEGVRAMFSALKDFADMIPWRFIAENLDTIAGIIVTGWAAGKIALVVSGISSLTGTFVTLSKALYGLAAAQTAAQGGFLFSSAAVLSLKAFGVGLAGALALIAAFAYKLADNADNAQLWTEAINGNVEALEKLSEEEQKFIKDKYSIGDKLKDDGEKAKQALVDVNESFVSYLNIIVAAYKTEAEQMDHLVAGFSTDIQKALKEGGEKGVANFLAKFGTLPPEMEQIMNRVIVAVVRQSEEIGKLGQTANTFSETVAEGIQKAIDEYQKYATDMVAKTEELIKTTGINAEEAWALLEENLKAKAASTSQELVKQFGNPAVASAFAKAFDTMAKGAGDAMTFRISDALNNVKSAINEISQEAKSAIDNFLAALSAQTPAYQNLQLKQVRETVDSIVFLADNGMSKVIRVYDKATGEIRDVASAAKSSGQESSRAFDDAADKIQGAGKRSGDAWTTGAIRPLEQTAQSANTVTASITGIIAAVQSTATSISTMAETITQTITTMGQNMVGSITTAMNTISGLFEKTGLDGAQRMMDAINNAIRNAIPTLSNTSMYAGQSMGQAMGRAMEHAMQQSIQNINAAISALERRIAAAKAAASSGRTSGGITIDPIVIESSYAREV